LILGKQQDIHTLCAYVDENQDVTGQVAELLASLPEQDEVIVITDIFAGSVNNEVIRYLHQPKFHLIAGLNLPLVIGLLISADEPDTEKLIHEALFSARESIQYCNHTIASAVQADKDF
jgi:fructoselysine and glucoselysine-specific PTS system IIA component